MQNNFLPLLSYFRFSQTRNLTCESITVHAWTRDTIFWLLWLIKWRLRLDSIISNKICTVERYTDLEIIRCPECWRKPEKPDTLVADLSDWSFWREKEIKCTFSLPKIPFQNVRPVHPFRRGHDEMEGLYLTGVQKKVVGTMSWHVQQYKHAS